MNRMHLRVHAPLKSAVKSGRAAYGTQDLEISDEFLAKIPNDLRLELARWVEAYVSARTGQGPDEDAVLELASAETTPENVSNALRVAAVQRREREISMWLGFWNEDDDWLVKVHGTLKLNPDIERLVDDPRIAARLAGVEEARKRGEAALGKELEREREAREGLRAYASSIAEYQRAAKEQYDVRSVALDHYVKAIAAHSSDTIVLVKASELYKRAKFEERTAPSLHAFDVLDGVTKFVASLPRPNGVDVAAGRITRYRAAVQQRGGWVQDEPVTVIPVNVEPHCLGGRVVLFFADAEEKKRFFVDAEGEFPF